MKTQQVYHVGSYSGSGTPAARSVTINTAIAALEKTINKGKPAGVQITQHGAGNSAEFNVFLIYERGN